LQNITAILELLRQKCSQVYNLLDSAVIFSKPKYQLPVADPGGGQFWGNCPPNLCGAPLPQMRHFLVPMEVKQIKKYSKINNVFRLVKRQDLRAGLYSISYRIA